MSKLEMTHTKRVLDRWDEEYPPGIGNMPTEAYDQARWDVARDILAEVRRAVERDISEPNAESERRGTRSLH